MLLKLSLHFLCIYLLFIPVSFSDSFNTLTFEVPNSKPSTTVPTAINNYGQVIGNYQDANGKHGFLYSEGKFTLINALDFTINGMQLPITREGETLPTGINDNGQIVGTCTDFEGGTMISCSFFYNAGNIQMLPNTTVDFYGINDTGQILSTIKGTINVIDGKEIYHPPLPSPAEYFPIRSLIGVNASGKFIASTINYSSIYKEDIYYIFSGNAPVKFEIPGANQTTVNVKGINDKDLIIGSYKDANDKNQIFVHDGQKLTLVDLDPERYSPTGLNAKGQIIGIYNNAGKYTAFIATPSDLMDSACPAVNATINVWSHDLILRDVVFNNQHYWAKLTALGNNQYKLIDTHPITNNLCQDIKVVRSNNNNLTLPSIPELKLNNVIIIF